MWKCLNLLNKGKRNKKGQTEDIFADLVPAIIISLVALYLFGITASQAKSDFDVKLNSVQEYLLEDINYLTYFKMPIYGLMKHSKISLNDLSESERKCYNPHFTIADLISRINFENARSGDDPCYALLTRMTDLFNQNLYTKFVLPDSTRRCLDRIELNFPSRKSILAYKAKRINFESGCKTVENGRKTIFLPLKGNDYVNITFARGREI